MICRDFSRCPIVYILSDSVIFSNTIIKTYFFNVAFSRIFRQVLKINLWKSINKTVLEERSLRMESTKTSKSILWPCGSLQSAAITASVAEMVAIVLVTFSYLEKTLSAHPFTIDLVAITLVSFFLMSSNLLMLYGSVKKMTLCLMVSP